MPSFIESLRDRILDFPLPELECREVELSTILNIIIEGQEDQKSVHTLLWIGLQQAQYRTVTLRGLRTVRQGHCDDPLFTSLTCAFTTFAQDPELQAVAVKKLNPGTVNMGHFTVATAVLDVAKAFPETLEPEERQQLEQEAKSHSKSLEEYLKDLAFKLLHEDSE